MTDNIFSFDSGLTDAERSRTMRQRPAVVWFTGLSGSGKTTVAAEVEKRLTALGFAAYLLDGDKIRTGLNAGLGFSTEDRAENIRRIYEAAYLLADSGHIVLVSCISPSAEIRAAARKKISPRCDFVEVYASAPLGVCEARDVKGLYKKARAGEIAEFTGISSQYEPPSQPELVIDTACKSIDECASEIVGDIVGRQYLHVLIPAALEAGKRIIEIYSRSDLGVEYKSDSSPLTDADKASDGYINEVLKREFPWIPVLSEESADDGSRLRSELCFIVDPLDGTKEFIARNGEFTVNIALSFRGEPVVGVIYAPATGALYHAVKGGGAFSVKGGSRERLHVSNRTDGIIIVRSRSHGDPREEKLFEANRAKIAGIVTAGSSLKGCAIADGSADVYIRYGYTMEWDTAAMQCIACEAGAIMLQTDGTPLTYNRENTRNEKGFYIINRPENDFIAQSR